MKIINLLFIALVTTSVEVANGGVSDKQNASPSPDAILFQKTKARSEAGEASAQAKLGFLYEHGRGVPQNYTEAVKWFRKAAERGLPSAAYSLAECYKHGRGVPHNYGEANQWYRKAADQGLASAQFSLSLSYYNSIGVLQDYDEALKWYRKAAEQGLAVAQYNLALRYGFGLGVPQDNVEAYKWLTLAAAHNAIPAMQGRNDNVDSISEPSSVFVSIVTQRVKEVLNSMTPAELAEGRRICREFAARKQNETAKHAILVSSTQSHVW